MFDKYTLGGGSQHHTHNVKVVEQRAPTDDSIRLAKEYEEKAWNSITSHFLQHLPGLHAKFKVAERRMPENDIVIMFEVNGEKFRIFLDRSEASPDNIVKVIAEKIAHEVTLHMMQSKEMLQMVTYAR